MRIQTLGIRRRSVRADSVAAPVPPALFSSTMLSNETGKTGMELTMAPKRIPTRSVGRDYGLSPLEKAICSQLNVSEEEFAKQRGKPLNLGAIGTVRVHGRRGAVEDE